MIYYNVNGRNAVSFAASDVFWLVVTIGALEVHALCGYFVVPADPFAELPGLQRFCVLAAKAGWEELVAFSTLEIRGGKDCDRWAEATTPGAAR